MSKMGNILKQDLRNNIFFRRIEAVLKCLGQSTDLAKKIALNGGRSNQLSKNMWQKGSFLSLQQISVFTTI